VTRSGRFTLLQKLAALAPVALLLACLPSETYLRCRIDGSVRTACCCGEGLAPANPGPVARAQDCCDREAAATAAPLVEAPVRVADGAVFVPVLGPAALAVVAPDLSRWDRPQQSQAPPRGGPPLLLVKQAFLI
jgi:hypothetical protein